MKTYEQERNEHSLETQKKYLNDVKCELPIHSLLWSHDQGADWSKSYFEAEIKALKDGWNKASANHLYLYEEIRILKEGMNAYKFQEESMQKMIAEKEIRYKKLIEETLLNETTEHKELVKQLSDQYVEIDKIKDLANYLIYDNKGINLENWINFISSQYEAPTAKGGYVDWKKYTEELKEKLIPAQRTIADLVSKLSYSVTKEIEQANEYESKITSLRKVITEKDAVVNKLVEDVLMWKENCKGKLETELKLASAHEMIRKIKIELKDTSNVCIELNNIKSIITAWEERINENRI